MSINNVHGEKLNMSEKEEITADEAAFAEQLTEERLRGQDWLKNARKLKEDAEQEEADQEEAEEAEAEAEAELKKQEDPFDLPKEKKRPSWLSGGIATSPENSKEIMIKKKRGRPVGAKNKVHHRDRAMKESIQVMTAAGLKPAIIAKILRIKLEKLQERFPEELEYGGEILQSRMVNALIQKGLDGNVSALIFYLKSKAGWKEADSKDPAGESVALSEVERTQRLMSILMGNPELLAAMKKKKQGEIPIEVTPAPKTTIVHTNDEDDEDEDGDVFDV